ncbi:Acyltransferases-like protein [Methylocella tundrae]|uniref:Acyltransferases-like protein n=1 Tax=Methylocella tundrae TaxID=227605 RepID=A0A8B6M9W9_METTU|nr:acyltransferase [Methylocella tundrae]VTZ27346.1 Acyltransferases-like protein [Methylocella tundrae]VTZ51541.1 Acyltransferases-like protein [Methylocella tundrae]
MVSAVDDVDQRDISNTSAPSEKLAKPKLRLHLLDSIRGWASLQVLFFHIAHEMFAHKVPELGSDWLGFILNGGFAVAVFFVLSGEVLAHGYFVRNDINIVRKLAIKRYVRLTIPIIASCFIVFCLMKANLIFSHQAAGLLNREDWLGQFLRFEPNIRTFLSYSLYGVYFDYSKELSYNSFLWTMSFELFGSGFVFLTLFVTRTAAQRWAVYAVTGAFMLVFSPLLMCFLFGMIFGEMRVSGVFKRFAAHPAANWIALFIVLDVGLGLTIYPMLPIPQAGVAHRLSFAAALFLFAIYSSNWLGSVFDNRLSHFLGELSFPIYLVHFPIIVSLQSYLVLRMFSDGVVTRPGAYLIILTTICASLLAAFAFRYVERFAIRASNSFFAFIDGF